MKRILFVISSLQIGWWAEKVCSTIWSVLVEKWYDVHFLTFYDLKKEDMYDYTWIYSCIKETTSENVFINFFKLFSRAYAIKKYCKQNKIQNSISFMEEANFSNILSKLFFTPSKISVSIRSSINRRWFFYKSCIKLLYNFSDNIVVITKEEKENLIQNYRAKQEKISVIYNPIDSKKIKKLSEKNPNNSIHSLSEDMFRFINIGRLSFPKNQELLIDCFIDFHKTYPNSELIILWEGPLRKDLEIKIWSHKNIYLLGLQKNPYSFLVHSNCFVFTSRYEWMPGVLLEASSLWLPIISTDCSTWPKEILQKEVKSFKGVTKTLFTDYGILTPINSKKHILEAMIKIYTDHDLQKKYQKKSLERSKDFQIENIIKEWEGIL